MEGWDRDGGVGMGVCTGGCDGRDIWPINVMLNNWFFYTCAYQSGGMCIPIVHPSLPNPRHYNDTLNPLCFEGAKAGALAVASI